MTIQGSKEVGSPVYGGYATGTGTVEDNTVYIGKDSSDIGDYTGIMTSALIYGGYFYTGNANRNHIFMSNGTVNSLTGGLTATSGSATNNIVSISASGKTYQTIYGGQNNSCPNGDLFTGNTLNLAAGNIITSVRNMATINFTSAGAAGNPLVKLDTQGNNIDFDGDITGSGGIDKQGEGILTLSSTNDYDGLTIVQRGTLDVSGGSIANSSGLELHGGSTFISRKLF
ncbi:hypothetical protein AGMMS49545_22490 [Betaproteobacteria bacterium]|nr:hypothetical protein AGMMS49545_22490 [Betaproteobacteria bacterium]GHU39938.1 hypothetical protein AGMMS50289_00630 [Betaproteobacteria bacterium]